MLTTRSVYLKTSTIISSSVSGAGWSVRSSGVTTHPSFGMCTRVYDTVHIHCMVSSALVRITKNVQYKLSTSNPLGFLPSYLIGTSTSSPSSPCTFSGVSSFTCWTAIDQSLDGRRVNQTHRSLDTFSKASGTMREHPALVRDNPHLSSK